MNKMTISRKDEKHLHGVQVEVVRHGIRQIANAGLIESFRDYLIECNYVDEENEMPYSATKIARLLTVGKDDHEIWNSSDYVMEFMINAGLTEPCEDDDEI